MGKNMVAANNHTMIFMDAVPCTYSFNIMNMCPQWENVEHALNDGVQTLLQQMGKFGMHK